MGTPVYYIALGIILVVLVAVLVLIRKHRRDNEAIRAYQERMDKLRAERQAEQTQYSTYNEAEPEVTKWRHGRKYIDDERYIPKYAAGDEMDSLKHKNPQKKIFIPTPVLIALAALFLAGGYALLQLPGISTQPNVEPKMNAEIVSTEPNPERTKVYVTLHFENDTAHTCYNIVTTVTLDYEDQTADSTEFTLGVLPPQTEQEEIITLAIPEEYRNQAYTVNAKTKYTWRIA